MKRLLLVLLILLPVLPGCAVYTPAYGYSAPGYYRPYYGYGYGYGYPGYSYPGYVIGPPVIGFGWRPRWGGFGWHGHHWHHHRR